MTVPGDLLSKRVGPAGLAAALLGELRSNRRAALGVLAIGLLAGAYGLILLGDAGEALRTSYVQASQRLQRIAASGEEHNWAARAAASAKLRQGLEARLWPADSDGVARADLQDLVTKAAREAGVARLRVTVELARPKELPPDLRQVTATIGGQYDDRSLLRFLDLIEREPRLLVVDRLHVQQHPIASFEMTLFAYARVRPAARPGQ
jgi:hypothetical protein